jgi:hypothetical protein
MPHFLFELKVSPHWHQAIQNTMIVLDLNPKIGRKIPDLNYLVPIDLLLLSNQSSKPASWQLSSAPAPVVPMPTLPVDPDAPLIVIVGAEGNTPVLSGECKKLNPSS